MSTDKMKRVYIMRGLPGSGKSTETKKIQEECVGRYTCNVHSTDDFFMVGTEYVFDPDRLYRNHKENLRLFKKSIDTEVQVVIVDNTNIRRKEFKPYVEYAVDHGYDVVYKVVGEFTEDFAHICFERNTHGVPLETILRMANRFQELEVVDVHG